jgi:hypothetical protein
MKTKRWLANGSMMAAIGAMALIPATAMAMAVQNYGPAQPACGCPSATVAPEARNLLNDVWRDAGQIALRTGSLENLANAPNVDRGIQDRELYLIQDKVNDMNNRLVRLEGMEQSLPAAEQRAINEAAPLVQSMTGDTAAAIGDLEAGTQYGGYAQMLNEEAKTVAREINTGVQTADLQQRGAYYQKNLGMLEAFGR